MHNQQDKMRSLLATDTDTDTEQLQQQHQEIQDLRQQIDNNRFETMLKIREILTPQQRSQMFESIGYPRKIK